MPERLSGCVAESGFQSLWISSLWNNAWVAVWLCGWINISSFTNILIWNNARVAEWLNQDFNLYEYNYFGIMPERLNGCVAEPIFLASWISEFGITSGWLCGWIRISIFMNIITMEWCQSGWVAESSFQSLWISSFWNDARAAEWLCGWINISSFMNILIWNNARAAEWLCGWIRISIFMNIIIME